MTDHGNMADTAPPPSRAGMLPATLVPEIWALIARFALAADGSTVSTWTRLSTVNQTFRSALAGEHTF